MNEEKATLILEDWLDNKGGICGNVENSHFCWYNDVFRDTFTVDNVHFTADQLEAIAWWMRNKTSVDE